MEKENKNRIDIELTEEIAQGIYANLAVITHSSSEFILDFVRILPGVKKSKVKSRVILTPENAKRLLMALQDNIRKYESINGKIETENSAASPSPVPPIGFGTTGQA